MAALLDVILVDAKVPMMVAVSVVSSVDMRAFLWVVELVSLVVDM